MSILDKFIHYYHKEIFLPSKKLFLNENKYFIVDYANVIHILYDKYKDPELIFKRFNHFLEKYSKTNLIFIVSKPISINEHNLNVSNIKLLKNVHVFNIEYKIIVSSNIDDLLTHFLCVVIFVGLLRLKLDPKNRIVFVTNDKQNFQKSLFELTEDERKKKISVNDVTITEITVKGKRKISCVKKFLNEYMTREKNVTLKCSVTQMVKAIRKNDFNYQYLNAIQKKLTNKCMKHSRKNGNLKKYFYLYVYMKYIQYYLRNDLFGSMKNEEIISLFQSP